MALLTYPVPLWIAALIAAVGFATGFLVGAVSENRRDKPTESDGDIHWDDL
jgi:uncharacterized protein YqfA (UPF0365 family)